MDQYNKSSHTVYDIKYHIIWVTKYRYHVLNGSVGKEHIHLLVSCPPSIAPSKLVQYLKGRSSRLLQEQFPELQKKYWGQHLWARGYFCATVGTVDKEMIRNYIANQGNEERDEMFKIEDEFHS